MTTPRYGRDVVHIPQSLTLLKVLQDIGGCWAPSGSEPIHNRQLTIRFDLGVNLLAKLLGIDVAALADATVALPHELADDLRLCEPVGVNTPITTPSNATFRYLLPTPSAYTWVLLVDDTRPTIIGQAHKPRGAERWIQGTH